MTKTHVKSNNSDSSQATLAHVIDYSRFGMVIFNKYYGHPPDMFIYVIKNFIYLTGLPNIYLKDSVILKWEESDMRLQYGYNINN